MSPQKPTPDSRHRSRPTSGSASPTKSPRKPGERQRRSASPDKRRSEDPEKRRSRTTEGKRRSSNTDEKRISHTSDGKRILHTSDGDVTREKRRSTASSPRKSGSPRKSSPRKTAAVIDVDEKTPGSSNTLSLDSLAKLDALNNKLGQKERKERDRDREKVVTGRVVKERHKKRRKEAADAHERKVKTKYISPASLEEAWGRRGGFLPEKPNRRKGLYICLGVLVVILLIILIPIGVLVIGKENNGGGSSNSTDSPNNGNLANLSESDIPQWAQGTYFDPFTWYDTDDFNVTVTNQTVGGLPVMGLNSSWDDSVAANDNVPPLNKPFNYGSTPIRGVNVGGWFAIEPFITPSLFNSYDPNLNIVDEYTLCQHLGSGAASTLEKHYSTFINKQSFTDIRNAGFDHVRIPFSYWAVITYPGDPYVKSISWRYLLRAIEWARQNGLRVNLDLHAVPGSQNGWNHSGRQGTIGWLNGTDGSLNAQRSLDIHNQLSQFFSQDRYNNVVGIYGLVNEPRMISLQVNDVMNWTTSAINIVRKNNITQLISMADGFLGLPKWKGQMQGIKNLVLDAHQYVIFNVDQIAFSHQTKLNFACAGWTGQMQQSVNTATG